MQNSRHTILILMAWFSLVIMACNLSSSDSTPPTVEPRVIPPVGDLTAQPTLGLQSRPNNPGGESSGDGSEQVAVGYQLNQMMNSIQGDRMYSHIEALVNVGTRHVNSSQTEPNRGIGAAYRYITDQLLQIQAESQGRFTVLPEGMSFKATTGDGKTTDQHNIVGVLAGTETGAGTLVIGAHYDSRTDDLLNSTSSAPAADDNGSGVAVVIELARILSQNPPRATVMFVWFSAEEHNRQGSRAFVRDYIVPNHIDVIAMINVDTVGSWNDSAGNIDDRDIRVYGSPQSGSTQLARMANFFGYNLDLALGINFINDLDREGRYGDHFSFDEAGYPSIRFIEALEDHYNREGRDSLDKVEVSYMVSAAKTILGVVAALADGPRPPRNIQLRDAGNGMQSLVWEPSNGAKSYIIALRRPGVLVYEQQFPWSTSQTEGWDQWRNFEGLAIAAVDANGMIGPLSEEFRIPH
jgi:hypothetical protein